MREAGVVILLVVAFLVGLFLGGSIGYDSGRQSVKAVACAPNVDGLIRNGKEVPLTSAQRDSLARGYPVRVR